MPEPSLYEVAVTLARVEAKQDAMLDAINAHLQTDASTHTDHEQRMRSLERARWRFSGMTAAVAALVSGVIAYFGK